MLVILALLGWHVHARSKPTGELNVADRTLLAVTGPIQSGLANVLGGVGGVWGHYVAVVGAAEENDQLRTDLAVARAATAELIELRAENDRLRAVVDLAQRVPGQSVAATVIGRGTSTRFRTIRIDRGTDAGLERGMPVVGTDGAVGRVLRASGGYADVLLLHDGLSAAGAVVQSSRMRGVLVGDGSEILSLGFVRRSDAGGVQVGDVLVTSGEDNVFPEGVALGTVIEATAPETGLFLTIRVEPAVDLDRLDEVLVVLDRGVGPFPAPDIETPMDDFPPEADADGATDGDAP
ncbi:MAG: rod shape-determining protein MreC [Proteobacteria bacterium]|nr:rod shape-determining protein MreC [Pseudomonadota bacterium]